MVKLVLKRLVGQPQQNMSANDICQGHTIEKNNN